MTGTMTAEERKELADKKRQERIAARGGNVSPVSVGQPADSPLSILRKVSGLGAPSTLVIGNAGTGKSTYVKRLLLENGANPLWMPLNNAAALQEDPDVAEWATATVGDWKEFQQGIYQPVMRGEISGFNALVIDGGNVLTAMALAAQAPSGQAEQSDWLKASNNVRDALVKLREKFGSLYMMIDIVTDNKTGARKIDLNPYTRNILLPLFGSKVYTHLLRERDEKKTATGRLFYTAQTNPALALEFVPGDNITIDTAE